MRTLLAQLSASDFAQWQQFYQLEPFGSDIDDLRFANIAATVAKVSGVKLGLNDFRLTGQTVKSAPDEAQDPEEIWSRLVSAFGFASQEESEPASSPKTEEQS